MFKLTVSDDLESYRSLLFLAKKKVFSSYRFWNRNRAFCYLEKWVRENLVFIFKVTQFSSVIWIGFQSFPWDNRENWPRHKMLMFGKGSPCLPGNDTDFSYTHHYKIKWHALGIGHWDFSLASDPGLFTSLSAFVCKLKNKPCAGIPPVGGLCGAGFLVTCQYWT